MKLYWPHLHEVKECCVAIQKGLAKERGKGWHRKTQNHNVVQVNGWGSRHTPYLGLKLAFKAALELLWVYLERLSQLALKFTDTHSPSASWAVTAEEAKTWPFIEPWAGKDMIEMQNSPGQDSSSLQMDQTRQEEDTNALESISSLYV